MTRIVKTHKTGIELIAEERQRQIDVEGWSSDHDDSHENGELALAASSYLTYYCWELLHEPMLLLDEVPYMWPWSKGEFKPKDAMRNLVRAGALIAAEIDRLQRKEKQNA